MNKFIARIVSLIIVLSFCGCSAFRPSTQTITINSSVQGADIYLDGNPIGKSPATATIQRNRNFTVLARKPGFEPMSRTIGTHLNDTGTMDVVGLVFCLFPGIGLLTPGAWSVDETTIMIHMFPLTDPYVVIDSHDSTKDNSGNQPQQIQDQEKQP